MNPQQQGYSAPPPASNPYDFIVTPGKPPKKKIMGSNDSFVAKLVLIVGGTVILMIVIAVVVNLLIGGKTNVTDLIAIAETQQEIIRVATKNTTATDPTVIGVGLNTQLVLTTQQQKLITYLQTRGAKIGASTLASKKNATTDQQLQQATAANNFDNVFSQINIQELQGYVSSLKTSYINATSTKEKTILATDYNQAQLLLKQWPAPQQATSP